MQAARFLAQASMGASRAEIARVQQLGYAGWLDEQFSMAPSGTRWDWMVSAGFAVTSRGDAGADSAMWKKLCASPDTLRQRVTLALSEILVVSITGFSALHWQGFPAAVFLDLLEEHAFGNYRSLLQQASLSLPLGEYLTYRGNAKFNTTSGSMPDENYARELMQLFTIGLVELNLDGTQVMVNGAAQETYTLDDVMGLARVFTGWDRDYADTGVVTPDYVRRPMKQVAARHESGSKTFLGKTIPAGTDGPTSLTQALDIIFAHPNVAPFIGKQLIQRLVCSNPSAAYVARTSAAFNNDGSGVKGNLKAVIRAILLDEEARAPAGLKNPRFGKLREPILRMTAWARAYQAASPLDAWGIGNTSDPSTRLGQSPLRSSSVFNFFRPGYVPPDNAIANADMVAPEFQIANESTVVGYLNFMQLLVSQGIGDVKADYSSLLPLANNVGALIDEVNVVLAAGQLSPSTVTLFKNAVNTIPSSTDRNRLTRVHAAVLMVLAAPEFIIQK